MWQQSLPLDHSPNLPCACSDPWTRQGQEHTISLVLEDRVALPFKSFCAARNSLRPGPARGNCPILHYLFLHCDHSGSSILTLSQLLPSPALSLSSGCSCVSGPRPGQRGWVGEHLACSVHDPRWPCRCCTESFPPPLSVVPSQGPPNPSGSPRAHVASSLARVCLRANCLGALLGLLKKKSVNRGSSFPYFLLD